MVKLMNSTKRLQVDQAVKSMVIFLAITAFLIVFCLAACRALLSQRAYQSRVIDEKTKALAQLKANNASATQLVGSYKAFVASPVNIIEGLVEGTGDRDGDNAKIVLDALPSKYDFPALATSLDKLSDGRGFTIESINGVDDELNQALITDPSTAIEIPFELSASGNFASIQDFILTLERSIRPITIRNIAIGGNDNQLTINVAAKTYYQPEKKITVTKKVIQ